MTTRRTLDDPLERNTALGDLEALLFATHRPLALNEIARRLALDEPQALELLGLFRLELDRPARGLQLRETGGRWRLETRLDREDIVAGLRVERGERPLSAQALETLAVVALRQPVTTEEVTAIRGAESYGTIETLRKHKFIARVEASGHDSRAAHWRTTQLFLQRFGLRAPADIAQQGRLAAVFADATEPDEQV